MNTPNDGGPAFAQDHREPLCEPGNSGMSLRDYFAAAALQGLLACPHVRAITKPLKDEVGVIAREAYDYADAMLEARKTKEQP